jgi:glycosyltransferase involved in cell wall biosynthesis
VKLHTVFITHNRLELTKIAVASYLETVTVPYTYVIVDNASTDGTVEWLRASPYDFLLLPENRYPGYACNTGWDLTPDNVTHLHRADNDFRFLPGWCEEVERIFASAKVGQVGLRMHEQEPNGAWNVGGNNVIRRELWDAGLRYDERPWTEFPPGYSEDSFFSPEVERMGYTWTRVKRMCIQEIETPDGEDPYYQHSWGARRIHGFGLEHTH